MWLKTAEPKQGKRSERLLFFTAHQQAQGRRQDGTNRTHTTERQSESKEYTTHRSGYASESLLPFFSLFYYVCLVRVSPPMHSYTPISAWPLAVVRRRSAAGSHKIVILPCVELCLTGINLRF